MGKRSRVKTNIKNEERTKSTSSTYTRMSPRRTRSQTRHVKIVDGEPNKKRQDSANPRIQVHSDRGSRSKSRVKEEATIHDLPPEMLTEILKCVDTPNLFKCRLINKKWKEISTGILTRRSDAPESFDSSTITYFKIFRELGRIKSELKSITQHLLAIRNACVSKTKNK